MPTELLGALPTWLLLGIAVGAGASLIVAGAFYAGDRLFPTAEPSRAGRIDGNARRRGEIREYLRAIDEPFVEDRELGGRAVAFYLPRRDVAITFDAQAYFLLESADTYVVLIEAEMPVRQLGKRFPFEVPELEPEPADAADPIARAFRRLGLQRGASESEVRSAYRRLVKDAHPDRGGSEEEFKRLREAYTTARNHTEQAARPRS